MFGVSGVLIVLLCQRFFFTAVAPDEVAPPLWVMMGAAAIGALAAWCATAAGLVFSTWQSARH